MIGCERSPGMLAYVRWRPSRVRGLTDRHRREKAHREVREASEEQTLHCRRVSLRGYSSDGAWRFATEDRREPVAGARYIYQDHGHRVRDKDRLRTTPRCGKWGLCHVRWPGGQNAQRNVFVRDMNNGAANSHASRVTRAPRDAVNA